MNFSFKNKKWYSLLIVFLSPFIVIAQDKGIDERIDEAFAPFSQLCQDIVFVEIAGIPLVLILLVFGALFFTITFGFVNIRHFKTAINVVRGKYDRDGDEGDADGGCDGSETEEDGGGAGKRRPKPPAGGEAVSYTADTGALDDEPGSDFDGEEVPVLYISLKRTKYRVVRKAAKSVWFSLPIDVVVVWCIC